MKCIIKNIPPQSFNIAGNRGTIFPLVDVCPTVSQPQPPPVEPEDGCYLVWEDGYTEIFTESGGTVFCGTDSGRRITCTCTEPIDICYLALQENVDITLNLQEDGGLIFCSQMDRELPETNCFLAFLSGEEVVSLVDEDFGDLLYIECEDTNPCFLTIEVDGVPYSLVDEDYGDFLFIECDDVEECFLTILVDGIPYSLVDEEFGDLFYVNCYDDYCYLTILSGDETFNLYLDEENTDTIVDCIVEEEDLCFLALEDGVTPLLDQEFGDLLFATGCGTEGCALLIEACDHNGVTPLGDQERCTPFEIECDVIDNCYLVLQDGTPLVDQEYRDHLFAECPPAEVCYLVLNNGIPIVDQEFRELLFTECAEEEFCYLSLNNNVPLVDEEYEDYLYIACNDPILEDPTPCYLVMQTGSKPIGRQEDGGLIAVECDDSNTRDALVMLYSNPLVDQEYRESIFVN